MLFVQDLEKNLNIKQLIVHFQEKTIKRNRLQLVGVTAMLLASKYEEMFAPEVADFVYITDNAYNKAEIREMERDILRTLNFSFGKPLCLHFLRRNSKAGSVSMIHHFHNNKLGWILYLNRLKIYQLMDSYGKHLSMHIGVSKTRV